MKLKRPLNYAGRLFDAGEEVKGKLPLDFIQALEEKGGFEDQDEAEPLDSKDNLEGLSEDNHSSLSPTRSVAELEEYLKSVEDLDHVSELLEKEKASNSPRASAIKVLEKRLKELANE